MGILKNAILSSLKEAGVDAQWVESSTPKRIKTAAQSKYDDVRAVERGYTHGVHNARVDYNTYHVIGACTAEKIHSALKLALEMAKESYPHLIDDIQFALDCEMKDSEFFIGSQNKPKTQRAYSIKKH